MIKKSKNLPSEKKTLKIFLKALAVCTVLFPFIYAHRKQIKEKVNVESEHFAEILVAECDHIPEQIVSMKKKIYNNIKDFFIPHTGNDHQPQGLSTKALKAYALVLIIIKIVTVAFLFFTYPNPAVLSQKISQEIFELTNTSRTSENLGAVVWNDELARAAQAKADNMIAANYFAHVGPDGKQPWQWIDKATYHFLYMGENLAMDFSSAQIAHSAFKQSPSHWKNIMNPKYQDMGVGVAVGKIDGRDTIVLVEFFGSEKAPVQTAAVTPPIEQVAPIVEQPTPVVEPTPVVTQPETKVTPPTPVVTQPETKVTPPTPVIQPVVEPVKQVAVNQPVEVIAKPLETSESLIENKSITTDVITEQTPLIPQELTPEITQPTEFNVAEAPVIVPSADVLTQKGLVDYVIQFSRYAFLLFLVGLCAMLLVNVLVKPHIQHSRLIMQTLGMVVFVATLLLTHFHFIEQIQHIIIY